jgi:hypothetical protein
MKLFKNLSVFGWVETLLTIYLFRIKDSNRRYDCYLLREILETKILCSETDAYADYTSSSERTVRDGRSGKDVEERGSVLFLELLRKCTSDPREDQDLLSSTSPHVAGIWTNDLDIRYGADTSVPQYISEVWQ